MIFFDVPYCLELVVLYIASFLANVCVCQHEQVCIACKHKHFSLDMNITNTECMKYI